MMMGWTFAFGYDYFSLLLFIMENWNQWSILFIMENWHQRSIPWHIPRTLASIRSERLPKIEIGFAKNNKWNSKIFFFLFVEKQTICFIELTRLGTTRTNSKKIDCRLFRKFYECVFYGIEIIYDLNLFIDDFGIHFSKVH